MKVLIDHGTVNNHGDTAMLEAVVGKLRKILPMATLHVIDRPGLTTSMWKHNEVERQHSFKLTRPLSISGVSRVKSAAFSVLSKTGRRLVRSGTADRAFALQFPDWMISPGCLRLSLPRPDMTLREYCREFDALHVAGGGTMTDLFSDGLIQRCALVRTFAELGKPVVLSGQQIGPFRSRNSSALVARALRRTSFVGLRESEDSLAFCEHSGIAATSVMGDDSFGLRPDTTAAIQALEKTGLIASQFLAVNLRVASYASEHEQHLETVARVLGQLKNKMKMPLLVVPISYSKNGSDIEAGYKLKELIQTDITVLDDPDLSASAIKGVLGLAHGAIGVSYHFCTFALSQGVPSICLHDGAYYGQKAKGLAAFWGDPRLEMALESLSFESAAEEMQTFFADSIFRSALKERSEAAHRLWSEAFESAVTSAFV